MRPTQASSTAPMSSPPVAAAAGVAIPDDINVVAEYPIAVTKDAPNPAGARAFLEFVQSAAGQAILASYGFLPA